MTYAKLFSSLLYSTIWQAPDHVRLVWITMLAMKDQDGIVEASVPGLAKAANVSVELTRDALLALSSPDPDSRTPDHEGRRIAAVDGGWRVLNHEKYRAKEDAEERRRKEAERSRRRRTGDRPEPEPAGDDRDRPEATGPDRDRPSASGSDRGCPDPTATDRKCPERPPSDTEQIHFPERVRDRDPDPPVSGASHRGPGEDRTQVRHPPPPPRVPLPEDRAQLVRSLLNAFVVRVNAARSALAREFRLGEGVRPIAPQERDGELELLDRLRDVPDPEGDLDHVLRVAIREARATTPPDLRWLGWSLAHPKAWRIRLATALPARPRPPGSAPAAAVEIASPARAEITAEDRAELVALAKRIAANPGAPERNLEPPPEAP